MKYYEADFTISVPQQLMADARDILSALAGEAGFETFEETPSGLKGYVQQAIFNRETLNALLADFPFEDVSVSYTVSEAEDRDWNEQWEQEGFEPIMIPPSIVIHDGRHLPSEAELSALHSPLSSLLSIEIDAHLAFGTGTHETTRMMVKSLTELNLQGRRVLDCGCGTGILGIAALKLGAAGCTAYDIDEWSADNARHNAVINRVDDRFDALLGDASILEQVEGTFDVVMANINRNILLADMPAFRSKMSNKGTLLLSGFYQDDIALLQEKGRTLGLSVTGRKTDGDWACLKLQLSAEDEAQ